MMEGVEHDMVKAAEFFKKAAVQGHVESRFQLALNGAMNRNYRSAYRHLLISANMGHETSVGLIRSMLMDRVATKEQYAHALKGYQEAVEEMKSPERDEAKAMLG